MVGVTTGCSFDFDQLGATDGQGASLVEDRGPNPRKGLQRRTAFHQDAGTRGARHAAYKGNGGSEDERARRRDHQHGERSDRIAGDVPSGPGNQQGRRQQEQGKAVGQSDERGLRGLRRSDHAHDRRIGALLRQGRSPHAEGLARIDRAAAQHIPRASSFRQRLSRHRELVERGRSIEKDAVDGKQFAGTHHQSVADGDLFDGDGLCSMCRLAMRDTRRPIGQRLEIPLGAATGEILENRAAGIHDRDYHCSQGLTEQQRGGHRHQRNRINAEAADPEIAQYRNGERSHHRQCRRRPDRACLEGTEPGSPDSDPKGETQDGNDQQCTSQGGLVHAMRSDFDRCPPIFRKR